MKRDDMNIDEILKQHLPRASQEDIDTASDTVLKRIREMRFQSEAPAAAKAEKAPAARWLHDYHVGILMAVDELQGYGQPVSITLKAEEILEERVMSGAAVFLILLLMERMGMVSSSPIDPEKPEESDQRYFAITELGRETLKLELAARQGQWVRRPLKGLA